MEFLYEKTSDNQLELEQKLLEDINDAHEKITRAKSQLQSENYSRMIVELNLPEEGPETFDFLNKLHDVIRKYYPDNFYVVGNPTSDYDLSASFSIDNILISILSALFVVLVLIFTFMSVGLPLLLILVIQGSIWINFSFPYLMNSKLFFLGYLVVNSIQMGANIDYAIVISNRYSELKKKMPINKAIVTALNQSFPTIITSGTILASAGWLIGLISTDGAISAVGICLGRGTMISIALVMCVLPQILLLGDTVIEKTRFKIDKPDIVKKSAGTIFLNGRVRGYISGLIDANIHGIINGKVNAIVDSTDMKKIDAENFLCDNIAADSAKETDKKNSKDNNGVDK